MSLLCAFAVGDWRSEAGMGLRPGLRGCGRGRSVESRAGSEAMRGWTGRSACSASGPAIVFPNVCILF